MSKWTEFLTGLVIFIWMMASFIVWWALSGLVEPPSGNLVPPGMRQITRQAEVLIQPYVWRQYIFVTE